MTMRGPGGLFGQWKAVKLKQTWITASTFKRRNVVSHVIGFVEYRQVLVAEQFDYPFRAVLQFRIQTACSAKRWYNFKTTTVDSPYGDDQAFVLVTQSYDRKLTDKPKSRVCERCRKWAANHARYLLADM